MARFVWKTGGKKGKWFCWDTVENKFAQRDSCPSAPPEARREAAARESRRAVEGARFRWRKVCWDYDTDDVTEKSMWLARCARKERD